MPEQATQTFLEDVLGGMAQRPKSLPCKYFYDERGSQLFDRICELEEYYPTRTELSIMEQSTPEMAARIGPRALLVELGSGSSIKTRMLLEHLRPVAYVPVDISSEHLYRTAASLEEDFPHVPILPVAADFTEPFPLPAVPVEPDRCVVYFPGSTIGNFRPTRVRELLSMIRELAGDRGGLLIGVDLRKDRDTLEAAYDDCQGVTAEFNLNLLRRINRELDADFDLDQFEHLAVYNEELGRVEIYLVSQADQAVSISGHSFEVAAGETIHTEYSHKYTVDGFAQIASGSGLRLQQAWTDQQRRFAVLYLEP